MTEATVASVAHSRQGAAQAVAGFQGVGIRRPHRRRDRLDETTYILI